MTSGDLNEMLIREEAGLVQDWPWFPVFWPSTIGNINNAQNQVKNTIDKSCLVTCKNIHSVQNKLFIVHNMIPLGGKKKVIIN